MKKSLFIAAILIATCFAATTTYANTFTITNTKNCQYTVTLLFFGGSSTTQGIGANPSVTIMYPPGQDVVGAIFYDATTGMPLFTVGFSGLPFSYPTSGSGLVANCMIPTTALWTQGTITGIAYLTLI